MGCTHAPGAWGSWLETFMGWLDFWGRTRMVLRMHFPFSFIAKRVDVSMGCQRCESHKLVMAAVAEMRPGQSFGHSYIQWARVGRQGDPTTRPMFPQSHACYELQLRRAVNSRSCGLQLAAVAAGSCWLQLRLAWVISRFCGIG